MPQPSTDSCLTCKAYMAKNDAVGTCNQNPPDWKFSQASTGDIKVCAWPPVKNTDWCMQYKKN